MGEYVKTRLAPVFISLDFFVARNCFCARGSSPRSARDTDPQGTVCAPGSPCSCRRSRPVLLRALRTYGTDNPGCSAWAVEPCISFADLS